MNKKLSQLLTALICCLTISSLSSCSDNDDNNKSPEEDASQFVVLSDVIPDVILEIRYYSTYNFIGRRIPGYDEPIAMLTRQAADSLKKVSDDLVQQGYRQKIFDVRPNTEKIECSPKLFNGTGSIIMVTLQGN